MLSRLGPAYQVFKTALAAGLAWQLATLISKSHAPYFAPLAVIVTLQATVADTLQRALYRLAGMVGGVVVSVLVLQWLHIGAVAITVALLVGLAFSTLLGLNPQITSQVGVTALLVLVSTDTRHYATDRVLETALGAVVAIGVNALVIPPDLTPQAEQRIGELTDLLARSLRALSRGPDATGTETERETGAIEQLEARTADAREALASARQSIRYVPFLGRRGARLEQLAQVMPQLEQIGVHVLEVHRAVDDLGEADAAHNAGLSDALQQTAAAIAAIDRCIGNPGPQSRSLLDGALEQARASQSRCLSHLNEVPPETARELGSILRDLKRISSEVALVADRHDPHASRAG